MHRTEKHTPRPSTAPDCVLLLHGLGRTCRSMAKMARSLQRVGYETHNIDYPSRGYPIEKLAMTAIPDALARCRASASPTIHAVTHSMGGLLLRYYLKHQSISDLGHVVMLSPPNHGSEAADALKNRILYRWLNGPAGQQLGTGDTDIAASLGPANFSVGIIAGNRPAVFDSWLSGIIPGPDDGKVSVNRTKLDGMTDFLVLPYAHTFIMKENEVIAQTIHFLRHGRFRHTDPTGTSNT